MTAMPVLLSKVTATRSVVVGPAENIRRVFEAGVTAYLLYNGSATYVQLRA